jgi:pimeloyl-ACP methyl ester carboxylesterase
MIRGLVLLAAPARPLEELILDQQRHLNTLARASVALTAEVERQVARVKSTELAQANPREVALGLPISWWLSVRGYSPVQQLTQLEKPSLILQGGRDFQVTAPDLALWNAALGSRSWATVRELPGLNHLFEAGSGEATPKEYLRPGHVDETAVAIIADWILGFAAN